MGYWVKILDDRKKYVVNFDYVNVFCYENKARITFWFPDSAIPIVLNPKSNLDDYEKIIEHIEYLTGLQVGIGQWLKITYERN